MGGVSRRAGWLTAVAVALVVALAVAPKGVISSSNLKVSLDALASISVCFGAAVAIARRRGVGLLSSGVLGYGLVIVSASMVLLVTVPALLDGAPGTGLRVARTLANLACALLLIWIAVARPPGGARRASERRPMALIVSERRLIPLGVAVSLAIGVIGVAIGEIVASPPSLDACYGISAVGFIVAAAALVVRASRSPSPMSAWWLALSAIFAAGTMIAFLLGSTAQPNFVSVADLMRAASLVALAAGGVTELSVMRGRERAHAIGEERRRVACELHDGVAQELSYVAVQAGHLAALYPDAPGLEEIRAAATLALEDCRTAIAGALDSTSPSLSTAIALRAGALARRSGLELTLDVADDVETSAEVEHGVVLIIREAISNTAQHSGATRVAISLRRRVGAIVVRISDDGRGFEPGSPQLQSNPGGGFGLDSMRERARRLGGDLMLESHPGVGTTIEVSIPQKAARSARASLR